MRAARGRALTVGADAHRLAGRDSGVRVPIDAGFRPQVAILGMVPLFDRTLGTTFAEQADSVRPFDTASGGAGFRAALDLARHPTLSGSLTALARADPEARRADGFEWGLRLNIAGLRAQRDAAAS